MTTDNLREAMELIPKTLCIPKKPQIMDNIQYKCNT